MAEEAIGAGVAPAENAQIADPTRSIFGTRGTRWAPVDHEMRQREAREALDKARDDVRWFKGELEAIAREASRACAERDAQIESLEFALAGMPTVRRGDACAEAREVRDAEDIAARRRGVLPHSSDRRTRVSSKNARIRWRIRARASAI